MLKNSSLMRKGALCILIIATFMSASFALDQMRAENSWPVQRNFTRPENNSSGTDKERALRNSIRLSPDNAAYHILLGRYYTYEAPDNGDSSDNQLAEAVAEYRKAIVLNPSYTDTLSYMAWTEFSLHRPFDALSLLETATSIDPNNYFNHLYYGVCVTNFLSEIPGYLRESYLSRAEAAFERGLELNPIMEREPLVFSSRADLYLRRGDVESAIAELSKSASPSDASLPYRMRLASLYLKAGMAMEGIKQYTYILEHPNVSDAGKRRVIDRLKGESKSYPENLELKYLLGSALVQEKDWANAIEALKGLASQGFRPGQTHYMLAQSYEALGDRKSAYDEYVITLRYVRNHPVAAKKVIELFKEGAGR